MLIGLLIYFEFVDVKGCANLVYVHFYSFLLFGGNQKNLHCLVCAYYAILTYFFKKILKISLQPNL